MKRRGLIRDALIVCALVTVGACSGSVGSPPLSQPTAAAHRIQHIVILLQENRSFNNLFMGFPGADTASTGKCKRTKQATWCPPSLMVPVKPYKLEGNGAIGGINDISHNHAAFEVECDLDALGTCRMDGFDLIARGEAGSLGPAKVLPYTYIERSETKPYWEFARQYALADRMFFTATASSFIAHQQIIAGTTQISPTESLTNQPNLQPWGCDAEGAEHGPGQLVYTPVIDTKGRVNNLGPFPCFTQYKTMADLLDPGDVSWKYYVPPLYGPHADFAGAVWNGFDAIEKVACVKRTNEGSDTYSCTRGKDWSHIREPDTKIFTDLSQGTLPSVSWVIPTLCESDHPASGANRGPKWVTSVVDAIGRSKYWNNTAIIILWDDWGGWYDNMPPPQINYTSLGFRVPMIVVSPYAKPHFVSHTRYDFGSVLQFIEKNFGLGSLGTSDATANSMDDIFDFKQRPSAFKPVQPPHVLPCPIASNEDIIKSDGGVPE
jgi:phospholipase C